jgi:hypothetical protein
LDRKNDETAGKRRRSRWREVALVLGVLVLVLGVARAFLPWIVRDYVNRTLDRNPLFAGKIGPVRIHLYRGAYSISDVSISKITANVPVPFFTAKRVDFAVQWDALVHGKIVGRLLMDQAQLNFVEVPSDGEKQTGEGGPWLQMIADLFPFKINRAVIHNSSVHFHTSQADQPVDVYLSRVEATIDNLSNIRDELKPLVATVQASALAMDQAKLDFKMTLDPFSYLPTFHLGLRLLGLDVTKINDLALAYGKFDFKRGWFDLVIEADATAGQITGYVKPLFRNLKLVSPKQDLEEGNVLKLFWQALLGAVNAVLKNQARDQFGTLIPFSGQTSGASGVDILATLGNLMRNAFVRAYLPRLENGPESVDDLKFEAPDLTSPTSAGDTQ